MKNLKKILCLITVLALALSFSACGGKNNLVPQPTNPSNVEGIERKTNGKKTSDSVNIGEFLDEAGREYIVESIKLSLKDRNAVEVYVEPSENNKKIKVVVELSKIKEFVADEKVKMETKLEHEKDKLKRDFQPIKDCVPDLEAIDFIFTKDGVVKDENGKTIASYDNNDVIASTTVDYTK